MKTEKVCSKCRLLKPAAEYGSRNDGYLMSRCRTCTREDHRAEWAANKSGRRDKARPRNKKNRKLTKIKQLAFVRDFKARSACKDCGEVDVVVLTFDHVDPALKEFNVADLTSRGLSMKRLVAEVEKCEVVCFNCHMRREHKRRSSV